LQTRGSQKRPCNSGGGQSARRRAGSRQATPSKQQDKRAKPEPSCSSAPSELDDRAEPLRGGSGGKGDDGGGSGGGMVAVVVVGKGGGSLVVVLFPVAHEFACLVSLVNVPSGDRMSRDDAR